MGTTYLRVASGDMSVSADSKTLRDKKSPDKHTPTKQDWVNSANAGFKVAEPLTNMNSNLDMNFLWRSSRAYNTSC